jgi:predicted DNA-binding ribbon-helix-helix protein
MSFVRCRCAATLLLDPEIGNRKVWDFCNDADLFSGRHSMRLIYGSHVSDLQQEGAVMKSVVIKRSVVVCGHKTSISLEDPFWKSLKEIAGCRHMTLSALLAAIDSDRHEGNLSSAIRLYVLKFYRDQLEIREKLDAAQALVGRSGLGLS